MNNIASDSEMVGCQGRQQYSGVEKDNNLRHYMIQYTVSGSISCPTLILSHTVFKYIGSKEYTLLGRQLSGTQGSLQISFRSGKAEGEERKMM